MVAKRKAAAGRRKKRAGKKVSKESVLSEAVPVQAMKKVISALIYGRSGSGKTTAAGTFPKPLLLIDIKEKGTDSISNVDGIDVLKCNDWGRFEDIYWELADEDHGYKTVVVDAVHSLQQLAISEAKAQAGKEEQDQTSQKDFGTAGALMTRWCGSYRDLLDHGINVVFLAHDRVFEVDTDDDDEMIVPEIGPRLMPSVASSVCGAVNVVGQAFIRERIIKSKTAGKKSERVVQYCLRVGPHGYYTTKIRSPKESPTPEFIVDPNYDKLLNVISGKPVEPPRSRKPKRRVRR